MKSAGKMSEALGLLLLVLLHTSGVKGGKEMDVIKSVQITQPSEETPTIIGTDLTIVCEILPRNLPREVLTSVEWIREDNHFQKRVTIKPQENKIDIFYNTNDSSVALKVYNISYLDQGKYICSATQRDHVTIFQDFREVFAAGPPVIIYPYTQEVKAALYNEAELEVDFYGCRTDECNITWLDEQSRNIRETWKDEKGETDSKSLYSSRKLTSENVTHDDLHSYTCVIQNVYGKASVTFILKADPFLLLCEKYDSGCFRSVDKPARSSVMFKCTSANHRVIPKLSWNMSFANGSSVTVGNKGGDKVANVEVIFASVSVNDPNPLVTSYLTIKDTQYSHTGNITCLISGPSEFKSTLSFNIFGSPKVVVKDDTVAANLGHQVSLNCTIFVNPPCDQADDLWWTASGSPINSTGRYYIQTVMSGITTISTLTIYDVQQEDITIFECRGRNSYGRDSKTVKLVTCPQGFLMGPDFQCIEEEFPTLTLVLSMTFCLIVVTVVVAVVFIVYRKKMLQKFQHECTMERVMQESEKRRHVKIVFTNSGQLTQEFEKVRLQSESERCNGEFLSGDEFPRERIRFLDCLGEGTFGKVVRSEALNIIGTGRWEVVAVKMCKETATDTEKADFLNELLLLRKIPKHLNIVTYYGCCTRSDPVLMVMEYAPNGDLLTYLRGRRPKKSEPETGEATENGDNEKTTTITPPTLTSKELFAFSLQIARGMKHLSDNNIVHRDVAARNVLLTDRGVCKITDFGLARDIHGSDNYERRSKGPLPIRWMAPEALIDGRHSTWSDVWSYGILVWEVVTLGASPYPGMSASQVFKFVNDGKKMEKPQHCTDDLYDLMTQCWRQSSAKRPTFDDICSQLETLLEREGDYINLALFEEKDYAVLEPLLLEERL
ncbi:fibroblast growth factor receptor 4-like isoform X1 [Pomacea canaliculata]|uniref:fibroblast growth factor receptor 4-like isoform X1 n=1 Tax=Pomacea canaliculata TaxID=400727 RepID=UPI000D73F2BF|nr:fibroblast growth factor receptor 4-like isoform X1 [Pomacea canaliculata]